MSQHVIPPRIYYLIFGTLLVLLFATWLAAQFDMGWLNIPIALAIAGTKMVLIMLYFMHLRYTHSVVRLAAVAGFLWLGIGAVFTFSDYLTRGWHSEREYGPGTEYLAPAIDRVSPGAERTFMITPPAQDAPEVIGN